MARRFGDHVEVALAQARRRRAQSEAEELHRSFERSLLPNLPIAHPGLHIHFHYRPGEHRLELGGDFIDVLDRGARGVSVIVGDVTGHGAAAAALGATLRAAWQAVETAGLAPRDVVDSLRQVLLRERGGDDTFATLCLAWIDPVANEIALLNLGHPLPLMVEREVRPVAAPPQPPLGALDLPVPDPVTIQLPEEWSLFFYTDGLIEARMELGSSQRFGEERLMAALAALGDGPLTERKLEALLSRVEEAGAEPFDDDVAVVVVSRVDTDRDAKDGAVAALARR
jgi:serine phosphatase RsbU (regulator of sigma subunit)